MLFGELKWHSFRDQGERPAEESLDALSDCYKMFTFIYVYENSMMLKMVFQQDKLS